MKSAWASKINWTQLVAFLAMVLTVFGVDLPEDIQAQMVVAIGGVQAVITWIWRTWFTTDMTYSSLK